MGVEVSVGTLVPTESGVGDVELVTVVDDVDPVVGTAIVVSVGGGGCGVLVDVDGTLPVVVGCG